MAVAYAQNLLSTLNVVLEAMRAVSQALAAAPSPNTTRVQARHGEPHRREQVLVGLLGLEPRTKGFTVPRYF